MTPIDSNRTSSTEQPLFDRNAKRWPDGARFAAVLSHDLDQLYDREMFRILADANHLRRTLFRGTRGKPGASVKRILRNMFNPRPIGVDIRRLRALEQRHGFQSTFYFLIDRFRFDRNGGRYRMDDPYVIHLARELAEQGCELGVHSSFFDFDSVDYLQRSRQILETVANTGVCGLRNHQLQFTGSPMWRAQESAGFTYDSTFGRNERPGALGGIALPFFPLDPESGNQPIDVLELPLTVMDTTLFRWMGLDGVSAAEWIKDHVAWLAESGSLGVFLWHNNFFAESEFREWEVVYEVLLDTLAREGAWVAPAAEVAQWWRKQSDIAVYRRVRGYGDDNFDGFIEAKRDLATSAIGISSLEGPRSIIIDGDKVEAQADVRLDGMRTGERCHLQIGPPRSKDN